MTFVSRLAGQRSGNCKSRCLTGRHHDDPCDQGSGDYDGEDVHVSHVTFGCNQRCPTVGLSPTATYRLGSKSSVNDHTTSTSSFDFLIPKHLPIAIDQKFKRKFMKIFRSKSHRAAQNHSAFAAKASSTGARSTPQRSNSKLITATAFDEMLRSNQTIYIGGVSEATSIASHNAREVLYSNIPLTSSKTTRPNR